MDSLFSSGAESHSRRNSSLSVFSVNWRSYKGFALDLCQLCSSFGVSAAQRI